MSRTAQRARLLKGSHQALLNEAWNRHGTEPRREAEPTFTLDHQVAHARAEMGEAKWAELQREWGA